jgi:predicted extracellular nuclease
MKTFLICLSTLLLSISITAQKNSYKISIVGFYNLENLYDTLNNTEIDDEEFLPGGPRNYNTIIYNDKLAKLSRVIQEMGKSLTPDGVAILGVAEIENDTVLTDLINRPELRQSHFKFIHYDSPDKRGVDVGLLYNPKYFTVLNSKNLFVQLPTGSKESFFTRDILWVKGILNGEEIHIYVNHWPSRRGGEERSAPARAAAAGVVRHHADSIFKNNAQAKIIIMGDLNDDPINKSLTKVIRAKASKPEVGVGEFYNPWVQLYKKGIGTLAYQDAWGLFDQILVSQAFLDKNQKGYFFAQQSIFNPAYLIENNGKYKGYPMRTWDGLTYRGGYSDHFPTYITLLQKIN